MVKKVMVIFIFLILISAVVCVPKPSQANSLMEIVVGSPPENAGERIGVAGGWGMIEFWHYSDKHWKATMQTGSGLKELEIKDSEAENGAWTDIDFLTKKIYKAGFMFDYNIDHPQPVLDAIRDGKIVTPVFNMDEGSIGSEGEDMIPQNFFNYDPLPEGLPDHLPTEPVYEIDDEKITIRAMPKLNCTDKTLIDKLEFSYPYPIPIVRTGFGSLSYALYYHNGTRAGMGYSPDPFYHDKYTIPYKRIPEYGRTHNGLDGREDFWLKDGYIIVNFEMVTVKDGDFNEPVLSYWGAPYCNMFKREGFSYEKTDYHGITFELEDGDIVFYDTDKRSTDDYRTGGTH